MAAVIPLHFATRNLPGDIAIRIAQYGYWATHVDVVLPGPKYLAALDSRGVNIYDPYPVTKELFVNLPCTDTQLADFMAWQTSQIGQPYALCELFRNFIFDQDAKSDGWFCSCFVSSGLLRVKWFKNNLAVPPEKLTVRDLALAISANGEIIPA